MMTLKRTYMNIEKKTRFNTPITDCDCEYYVTGVIPGAENVVILKALEKMIKALSNHEGTNDIISVIEMMINNNEFGLDACYNEMKNGGGAYEIEINDYNDGTLSIYIRVAEIDHVAEEPAAEEPAAEKPAAEEPAAAPDYSSFKGCTNCEICPKKCIHENTFRRLPYEVGGLGLCENL